MSRFVTVYSGSSVIILTLITLSFLVIQDVADAQYGGHGEMSNSHYEQSDYGGGGYGGGGYGDERPKVHLGIRLRIPAFKFELPRFSMPKITVSAKIRQPNRPRTITLPEINLDTSSKVSHGDKQGNDYGQSYDSHPSYSSGGYGGQQNSYSSGGYGGQHASYGGETKQFTFSTSGEDDSYHEPKGYQQQYSMHQQPNYSPTNERPTYMATKNMYQTDENPVKNPDMGFNSPSYTETKPIIPPPPSAPVNNNPYMRQYQNEQANFININN